MSTERLTGKDILEHCVLQAMKEYAAQEVGYKTKQLKEERDKAVDIMFSAERILSHELDIQPNSDFHRRVTNFLDQLNHQGEINVPSFSDAPQSVKEEFINHACEAAAHRRHIPPHRTIQKRIDNGNN